MKKLIFNLTVITACVIVFACQPPKPGGSDSPSKNNPTGTVEELRPQQADSSIGKQIEDKNLKDSIMTH